jgi:hypothetical protein
MPYVAPFHSTRGETYVFHDHDGCREGAKIKPAHRNIGTGNRRPCARCNRLHALDEEKTSLA